MNNREKLISIIKQRLNGDSFSTELDILMRVHTSYDLADALNDCLSDAEHNRNRLFIRICRDILVEAGAYSPSPVKTCVGRDTRFVHHHIYYDWLHYGGWEQWLEREVE